MRILIDIGHPGHVHLFKNFAFIMIDKGHEVLFTCREKEFEIDLLKHYGFNFKSFGKKYNSPLTKIIGLIEFDIKEFLEGLKFKPDVILSHGSIYAAHASFLLRKPHISLEDTFNFEQIRLYKPFTKVILTGDYEHPNLGTKEIKYSGYHELAYLYPKYFKPDKNILNELKIKDNEKYVILRFVSWNASHDIGQSGLSLEMKRKAVKELSKYVKVFISSEDDLPEDLKKYQIKIPPEKMHDALAFATMFIGESGTMATESAILGTPSIYVNSLDAGVFQDEVKYGLLFSFRDDKGVVDKSLQLIQNNNIKKEWQTRSERMLKDKIDVTAFMVWFIENYPESAKIMRENPDYQYRFK